MGYDTSIRECRQIAKHISDFDVEQDYIADEVLKENL
jgi:hypothetical protein